MDNILKRWRSITIGFLIVSYLTVIVFMHQPMATWLIIAGVWILILILIFLGTFIGILGVLLQGITRKQGPSTPLYRAAYKFGTRNSTILASYGLLLLRENNAEVALSCFDRALANSAYFMSTKTLKCNKAIALWKLDRVDEAIDLYLEVIESFGKDDQKFFTDRTYDQEGIDDLVAMNQYLYPQDYTTIGFLYTLQEQYEEATFFSKAALAKKDGFAAAYDNLGQIEFFQNNIPEAKAYFEKALELNPKLPDSLYFAGLVAIKEDDKVKANDYLSKAHQCKLDGLNTVSYEMVDTALEEIAHTTVGNLKEPVKASYDFSKVQTLLKIDVAMRLMLNDENLYYRTITRFAKSYEPTMTDALEAMTTQEEWTRYFHTLKGIAGTIGADKLQGLNQIMEASAKDPDSNLAELMQMPEFDEADIIRKELVLAINLMADDNVIEEVVDDRTLMDEATYKVALNELYVLVDSYDSSALDSLKAIKKEFCHYVDQATYEAVEKAVEGYEFGDAITLISEIL